MELALGLQDAAALVHQLKARIHNVIFGQDELVTEALCAFLAGGHILMTGAPGLAKTTLVRVFSTQLGLHFGRIQFTPDLLPSDIVGSDVLNIDQQSGKRVFEFTRGPIFTNLLLADEINRATPRTQSALLEAMQERSCTTGGTTHALPEPFMVFATQNPFESEGTFPLPEAQLDRFLIHSLVPYPDKASEETLLQTHARGKLVGEQRGKSALHSESLDADTIRALIQQTQKITIDDEMIRVVTELVRMTRSQSEDCPEHLRPMIWYGAGPRAGISLISACKSLALIEQSETVRWQHVKRMAKPVLRHRIRLTPQAMRDQYDEDRIIDHLIERIEARHAFLAKGIA